MVAGKLLRDRRALSAGRSQLVRSAAALHGGTLGGQHRYAHHRRAGAPAALVASSGRIVSGAEIEFAQHFAEGLAAPTAERLLSLLADDVVLQQPRLPPPRVRAGGVPAPVARPPWRQARCIPRPDPADRRRRVRAPEARPGHLR
jgi:hypothetical protein